MNSEWISPIRVIPFIVIWVCVFLTSIGIFAYLYSDINLVPDILITVVAISGGFAIVASYPIYNTILDGFFSDRTTLE